MNDADPARVPVAGSSRTGKRQRLAPDVRRQQILSAALHEFSSNGFEGATMEQIAQRTGLTKAGLYAHFSSKDQILETLLGNLMRVGNTGTHWHWAEGATLEDTIDTYLDDIYALIRLPQVQATFRLLILESARAPASMHQWSRDFFQTQIVGRQRDMDAWVKQGLVADNAVSRKSAVTSAPALIAMMSYMMQDAESAEHEVAQIRAAHRQMLVSTLRPEVEQ